MKRGSILITNHSMPSPGSPDAPEGWELLFVLMKGCVRVFL